MVWTLCIIKWLFHFPHTFTQGEEKHRKHLERPSCRLGSMRDPTTGGLRVFVFPFLSACIHLEESWVLTSQFDIFKWCLWRYLVRITASCFISRHLFFELGENVKTRAKENDKWQRDEFYGTSCAGNHTVLLWFFLYNVLEDFCIEDSTRPVFYPPLYFSAAKTFFITYITDSSM